MPAPLAANELVKSPLGWREAMRIGIGEIEKRAIEPGAIKLALGSTKRPPEDRLPAGHREMID
jgi:hypothetical protein